ncbi:MAG TPA: HAD family phosphatase [Chitinophagales bacterium]|nr:HAD family phosphatase [Chitinophagales bacterium]
MGTFKNLVFDLGNVIIDIDYRVTVARFQQLALVDFAQVVSYEAQHHIFDVFEKGGITAAQFRHELRQFLKPGTTDEQINAAWNAILIDFPPHKFEILKGLKSRYKTFALSNINEIHVDSINRVAQTKFGEKDFGSFFHAAYYSNEMGYRKPEARIYEMLLQKENLIPQETFFVDDKLENIEAAKAFGIQAYQLTNRDGFLSLLQQLQIVP